MGQRCPSTLLLQPADGHAHLPVLRFPAHINFHVFSPLILSSTYVILTLPEIAYYETFHLPINRKDGIAPLRDCCWPINHVGSRCLCESFTPGYGANYDGSPDIKTFSDWPDRAQHDLRAVCVRPHAGDSY
jgi:hypothetical protein